MIIGISSNFTMSYRCLSIDIFLDLGKFTGFESFRRWLQTHAWAKIELLTKWKDRSTYSRGLYTFIIHLYILCIHTFFFKSTHAWFIQPSTLVLMAIFSATTVSCRRPSPLWSLQTWQVKDIWERPFLLAFFFVWRVRTFLKKTNPVGTDFLK